MNPPPAMPRLPPLAIDVFPRARKVDAPLTTFTAVAPRVPAFVPVLFINMVNARPLTVALRRVRFEPVMNSVPLSTLFNETDPVSASCPDIVNWLPGATSIVNPLPVSPILAEISEGAVPGGADLVIIDGEAGWLFRNAGGWVAASVPPFITSL